MAAKVTVCYCDYCIHLVTGVMNVSIPAIATIVINVGCDYKFLNLYEAWC
jgi:hypothetical protein